jgi:ATP-binding cassette subfamily B protein
MNNRLKTVYQYDSMDCGPACLCMISQYYGKYHSVEKFRNMSTISKNGVSLLGLSDAAESIGFRTLAAKIGIEDISKAPLPCIIHWNQNHFVVLTDVYKKKGKRIYNVVDPALGKMRYDEYDFKQSWISTKNYETENGIILIVVPTDYFYEKPEDKKEKSSISFLFSYFRMYKGLIIQLIIGLFAGSLLQLILPFMTQSIVDYGINTENLSFVHIILLAQLILIISSSSVSFIRGWILLHLGTRINVSLISDFLMKLMKLPMSYFDSKQTGDIIQRINDHERIESFLTNSSLNTLFSVFNVLLFGFVLLYYSWKIFLVFIIGSLMYFFWILAFIGKRKELDYKYFTKQSKNQSKMIQLVTGMQEIKLHGCQKQKRWEWENIQASIFRLRIKGLALKQYQDSGAVLINQSKNIVTTAIAAGSVIQGEMTLGMMLSIQYIIGQMNAPVDQLVDFMRSYQDARLSLDRLAEIREKQEEDGEEKIIPETINKDISIKNLNFSYDGFRKVLEDINLTIFKGKITAIVGMSGSGKTTLIKLLLGYYTPSEGEILINSSLLTSLNMNEWRKKCGIVMQDGLLFSESIASNIATGCENIEVNKLQEASSMANIHDFITSLPLGYNTVIGAEGTNLSQGQKQRILIARAIYKNPEIIFLDEATNALDSKNEKIIMDNLQKFFTGRTVLIVAHRLSTVRNAHQIVVIDKGRITEIGNHEKLIANKGDYYNLIKNQLEI